MIQFYYHPTPNPLKVAMLLEETGLEYELIPVDTGRGEQHLPAFRAINPNGKVPAIVDTDALEGPARLFDSNAILLYLSDKTGKFGGRAADRPELLSWLFFIASGLGPFSGQSVHFQRVAPAGLDYAVNRYRREADRHFRILDDLLAERHFILGDDYSIVDMAAWAWIDRLNFILPGEGDPLDAYPNLARLFAEVEARPAAARARAMGADHEFKRDFDESMMRALYPSNYPLVAAE